jgi:hypothetical protein
MIAYDVVKRILARAAPHESLHEAQREFCFLAINLDEFNGCVYQFASSIIHGLQKGRGQYHNEVGRS